MSNNTFVPSPAVSRKIVQQRRQALCNSAREAYDSDPVTRWLINTLWVIGAADLANGRTPFKPAGCP